MTQRIPLALLPGTLCTAELWAAQVQALNDVAEIKVIDTAQYDNLADLARYVHTIMPEHFAVAGLSYGGIVALAVWRHNPQAISHLGLFDTTPHPPTSEKRLAQAEQVQVAKAGQFQKVIQQHAETLLALANHQHKEVYYATIMAMASQVGIRGFANQIKAQSERPDSGSILTKIHCPTLVLCGEQDSLCPPSLHREMAEKIPNSILQIVPQCGHLSALEQPEIVTEAMRAWL